MLLLSEVDSSESSEEDNVSSPLKTTMIELLYISRAQNNGLSQVIFWPILVYDRPNPIW